MSRRLLSVLAVFIVSISLAPAITSAQEAKTEPVLPISVAGLEEDKEGRFNLYVGDEPIGTYEFDWSKDRRLYRGKRTISMAGQSIEAAGEIQFDENGYWTKIEAKSADATSVLTREADRIDVETKTGEKTRTRKLDVAAGQVLYGDEHPVFLALLRRAWKADGDVTQKVPLLILPGVNLDGSITKKDAQTRTVGNGDMSFEVFGFRIATVEMEIWFDDRGRTAFIDIPSQNAKIARHGFEALLTSPDADPLLSKPIHDIVEQKNVMVAMRDGVRLATTLFRPADVGRYPAILVRTPYKKELHELQARFFARRGYVVALQDVRGRFESEGVFAPPADEPTDGYDTIQWLAGHMYCDGNIGMIGASYLGWVQWLAAREHPPHLRAMIPNVSPPEPFWNFPYEGGILLLQGVMWWMKVIEDDATADITGSRMAEVMNYDFNKVLRDLPVIDLDKKVFGKEIPRWRRWIEHDYQDGYWDQAAFDARMADMRVPVLHQSGWFDGDGIGAKRNYAAMRRHGHPNQKLVLGPWGHTDTATRKSYGRDFGPKALMDLQTAYLRWFDRWLKGVENDIENEPLVSLFVIGPNDWLHGNSYPLEGTRLEKWYLASDGKANTGDGDGRLSRAKPTTAGSSDRYVYDPGDPTPSPNLKMSDAERDDLLDLLDKEKKKIWKRDDILVYKSEPFTEPMIIAGGITGVLHASSSAKDTDWFMNLSVINKDGKAMDIASGRLRARFRESMRKPKMMEPGQVYEFELDMWQIGIQVEVGESLVVEVASAMFPAFARNLNTGGHNGKDTDFVEATQTIFHDVAHPSHVVIPVVPRAMAEKAWSKTSGKSEDKSVK